MFCHYLQKYHRHSLNKTKNIFGDLFIVQCKLIKIILRFKEKLRVVELTASYKCIAITQQL